MTMLPTAYTHVPFSVNNGGELSEHFPVSHRPEGPDSPLLRQSLYVPSPPFRQRDRGRPERHRRPTEDIHNSGQGYSTVPTFPFILHRAVLSNSLRNLYLIGIFFLLTFSFIRTAVISRFLRSSLPIFCISGLYPTARPAAEPLSYSAASVLPL